MAGKLISQSTQTTPAAGDMIPIGRPGDTTARHFLVGSMRTFTTLVTDYGAVGDGTTDDTSALQDAWDALPSSYGVLEFEPYRTYLVTDKLDFSGKNFSVIRGNNAVIQTYTGTNFANKAMVDFAGCAYGHVTDLRIESTLTSNSPAVGLLLGRTTTNTSGAQRFDKVVVNGYFSHSACYNVGAEVNTYTGCYFANYTDGGHAAYISNEDTQSLLDLSAGQLTGYYYGCTFHCFGTGGNNIHLRGYVADHGFWGCYGVPSLGGHFVHVEKGTAGTKATANCTFDGFRLEPNSGDNSDTRFLYQYDAAMQGCTFQNINWSMNSGTANDPDYVYELVGDNTNAAAVSNCYFFLTPNTYSNKTLLINDTAYLENCKFWGDVASGGSPAQVTVESGAEMYRCDFYWPKGVYPFDATPANTNLMQFVASDLTSANMIAFTDGDTSPSVGGGTFFNTANTGATTIIDFDDGYGGQEIIIYVLDAVTTFDFSNFGGSSNLSGNDGADYTAHLHDVIRAINIGGTYWFCEIIKSKF